MDALRGIPIETCRQALLRMRSGETDRNIARSGLLDRRKAASLRHVALHAGWLDPRRPLPDESQFARAVEASAAEAPRSAPGNVPTDAIPSTGPDRYIEDCERGQKLLEQGRAGEAAQVFQEVLARLQAGPSYRRAVVTGRLGRCAHMAGDMDAALERLRLAIDFTEGLPPSEAVVGLRGALHSDLGDVYRALRRHREARREYELALAIARNSNDLRAQGVDMSQLGTLALAEGNLEEALAHYGAALALFRQAGLPVMEAVVLHQLGRAYQQAERWAEAEQHFREAARSAEQRGELAGAMQAWSHLAEVLARLPGRLEEAGRAAQAALAASQVLAPGGTDVWRNFGVLADVLDRQAAVATSPQLAAELQARAHVCHELHRQAPRIHVCLSGLQPGFGRAVALQHWARCLQLGGARDAAIGALQESIGLADGLDEGPAVLGLRAALRMDMGAVLLTAGRTDEARQHFDEARSIALAAGDSLGSEAAERQLQTIDAATPAASDPAIAEADADIAAAPASEGAEAAALADTGVSEAGTQQPFTVWVDESAAIDYVFDGDLLLEGPRQRRRLPVQGAAVVLDAELRPRLMPWTRTYVDPEGHVRLAPGLEEPRFERQSGCVVMHSIRREIVVEGAADLLWKLLARMDGSLDVDRLVGGFDAADQEAVAALLKTLAAARVVDLSGRPVGRLVHAATKKGVVLAGGLETEDVLRLATDGSYRSYPDAPRIALERDIPEELRGFHALTRARRSRRVYGARPLSRRQFDSLLEAACGITGSLEWAGREVKLRAYPASGALYAVEIYPVVFRVESLAEAVYHYRPAEHVLEAIGEPLDRARFAAALLPVEREMVAGASAMICLCGNFPRHERKYGEGGYRMLVAEAGHISENLVLAATALGLAARPFGGVFDDLLNADLGLDVTSEQFLLSVLVGHPGDA